MADFTELLPNYGILGIVAAGIWRALVWIAPRIDRVVDSHLDFVSTLKADVGEIKIEVQEIRGEVGVLKEKLDAIPKAAEHG